MIVSEISTSYVKLEVFYKGNLVLNEKDNIVVIITESSLSTSKVFKGTVINSNNKLCPLGHHGEFKKASFKQFEEKVVLYNNPQKR